MKRWVKSLIETNETGEKCSEECSCFIYDISTPSNMDFKCAKYHVDIDEKMNRCNACLEADVTNIIAEKKMLKKALLNYFEDEEEIHKLASPYVPGILSEAGQKPLPMIVEKLVKEIEKYKSAMDYVDTYDPQLAGKALDKAQAEQEGEQ